MFLELVATFVVGMAAAGVVMLVKRVTGGLLARWAIPACAGAAMIAYTIYSEYNWYTRTVANLPEGMEIATTVEKKAVYRPWTYITPYIDRFAAVDVATAMTNEELPDYKIVSVVFMGRWSPVSKVRMLFDCVGNRRVDLVEGRDLGDDGLPTNEGAWVPLEADDPLLTTACKEV